MSILSSEYLQAFQRMREIMAEPDLTDQIRYHLIFAADVFQKMNPMLPDYYDPDTSYGEDVRAFVEAHEHAYGCLADRELRREELEKESKHE